MVQVYVLDITELPDPIEYPQIMEGLQISRKEKIMRCKQEKVRKQSLGAGLLLQDVLRRHDMLSDEEPLDAKIKTGPHGKPETAGLYFNLSHSKDKVVCAVSERPVGCDVEKMEDTLQKVAERFFCEDEKMYLRQFSEKAQAREFYRLWTMKESYLKMTGEGITIPIDEIQICFHESISVKRNGEIQNCHFCEYELPGYILTVCSEDRVFAEKINIVMTKLSEMSIISSETFKGE